MTSSAAELAPPQELEEQARALLTDAEIALRGGEVADLDHEARELARAAREGTSPGDLLAELVAARTGGNLLAHLAGREVFFGRHFTVLPRVLVPHPATELLAAVALAELEGLSQPRVVEVGVGSGAVCVTLLAHHSGARVVGSDISGEALALTRVNASRLLGDDDRLTLLEVAEPLHVAEPFLAAGLVDVDMLVANPPYMSPGDPLSTPMRLSGVDPRAVYAPEPDHSWFLRRLLDGAGPLLAAHAVIVVETLEWYAEEHLRVAEERGWVGEVFERVSSAARFTHLPVRPAAPSGHRVLVLRRGGRS